MRRAEDRSETSAHARFVLDPEQKDYNLDRIIRLAAMATGCRYAALLVLEDDHYVVLGAHGTDPRQLPDIVALCDRVLDTALPVVISDIAAGQLRSQDGARIRALAAMPVFSPEMAVIGVLCGFSSRPLALDTPARQRVLIDCVRLVEDSLKLRQDAVLDPLTGQFNRRFFAQQLDSEWRRAQRLGMPLSVLAIDVDYFKPYNDQMGHLAGDEVLRRIAERIRENLRRAGDLVCRYGGEEFLVLMPATELAAAEARAEVIRSAVERADIAHPAHPAGGDIVTVSIGVACAGSAQIAASATEDLVHAADQALYAAKRGGRNCVRRGRLPADTAASGAGDAAEGL